MIEQGPSQNSMEGGAQITGKPGRLTAAQAYQERKVFQGEVDGFVVYHGLFQSYPGKAVGEFVFCVDVYCAGGFVGEYAGQEIFRDNSYYTRHITFDIIERFK